MKDKCINCNRETLYTKEDHTDYRIGYVEGVGQLCLDCWGVIHDSKLKKEKELTNVS